MGNVNNETTQNTVLNAVDKDNKSPNVPNLRFPYFTKQWTNISFSSLFDILPNNTLSRAELNYIEGEYKNIHYGDILIKLSAFTNIDSKDIPFVNSESIPKNSKDLLLKNGDVVFADTAEDYTVGKATEIGGIDNQKIIAGLHTIPCRPKYRFVQRYLGYYVNSPAYHNQLLPYIQGIKVSSISKSLIKHTTISYPNEEEQLKIINLLTFIDNKLLTQSKIISDLEFQKKGLFDKLIKQNKSLWQKVKLSSILHERKTYATKDNSYPHATLSKEGISAKTDRYDRDFLVKDEEKEYKITHLNDICYNPANLKFGVICRNTFGSAIFSPIYVTYEVSSKCNPSFIELMLTNKNFLNYIRKYEQGTVYERMAVNSEDFLKGEISIPALEEQNKISKIFTIIDNKIQIEKDTLELYKQQKTYLLRNLFI